MAEDNQEQFQEKTEPASQKKKEDSRKKGKVARSMDVNSAAILVIGLFILYFGGSSLVSHIMSLSGMFFSNAATLKINSATINQIFFTSFISILTALAPISIGLLMIGLVASYSQVGFMFSPEAIRPKMNKINPLSGFKRIFASRRSYAELIKNLTKIFIIAIVAFFALKQTISESMILMDSDIYGIMGFIGTSTISVGLKIGFAFLAIAIIDYLYQKFEYEHDLKMTKQEVRDENKQTEGDPLIKSRIRSIQRQIAYKRMMQDVPTADFVVTNPTHIAVALKYNTEKMGAPKVIAKGAELIAQKIKEIAYNNHVPVVEDKILARMLYKTVDIGQEIPEKLFHAVAQVLAYVYRIKNYKNEFSLN